MPEDIWKTFVDNKIIRVTLCDKIREFIDIWPFFNVPHINDLTH